MTVFASEIFSVIFAKKRDASTCATRIVSVLLTNSRQEVLNFHMSLILKRLLLVFSFVTVLTLQVPCEF